MTTPMTPELDEALRQWAAAHEGTVGGLIDDRAVYVAYRAAQEAEPEPRFEVGQRVRMANSGSGYVAGTVVLIEERPIRVRWDDSRHPGNYPAAHLEPIPDTLPPDHLDRFWRVGAWLTNGSVDYHIVVMSANAYARLWSDGSITSGKQSELDRDGWSFHAESPIKEEVEL